MEELFIQAENFRFIFNHPYVGTEHFFLAFLKVYRLNSIKFNDFKDYMVTLIGYGTICSDYVLYTPILRDIKNKYRKVKDAVKAILINEDSIVHSILTCKKVDIDSIIIEIDNSL